MLEKLATHDVQEVSELFSLADKCARAAEGHAWHSQPAPEAGKASKPEADVAVAVGGVMTHVATSGHGSPPAATRAVHGPQYTTLDATA
jgi:hypothetical protein